MYNKTQLHVASTFERHVFHRDQFAHFLRWSHVLKIMKRNKEKILDLGSGDGQLLEVLYRNRRTFGRYLGVDVRTIMINKMKDKFKSCKLNWDFIYFDVLKEKDLTPLEDDWDYITSFEVFEHIGKNNGEKFLKQTKKLMNENTVFIMSTPCYDESVGAAGNHTYDSGDGRGVANQEWEYEELKKLLEKHFDIVEHYGTFASQRDYKKHLTKEEKELFDKLNKFHDVNIMSVIFAPLYPQYSRNCMWKLKLKK